MFGFSRHGAVGAALLLATTVSWAVANLTGPPVGASGAPGGPDITPDRTCNQASCHIGNSVNNANGSVALLDLPDKYTPGKTYDITLQLMSTSTGGNVGRRWGFQITALRLDLATRAGTWTPQSGQIIHINPAKQRDYLSHTITGVQQGTSSPVTWHLRWTAPATEIGPVGFFFTGNAANGNGTNLGDFIYAARDTTFPETTGVKPVTWGGIKLTDWDVWHP